jgi:hypothetical protein
MFLGLGKNLGINSTQISAMKIQGQHTKILNQTPMGWHIGVPQGPSWEVSKELIKKTSLGTSRNGLKSFEAFIWHK